MSVTTMTKPAKNKSKKTGKPPKSMKGKLYKLSKEVAVVKKELKKDVEYKNFDGVLLAATLVGWDSNIYNLFAPAQGVGQTARTGDKVYLTNIDLRYRIWNTSASLLSQCRVVVFIDYNNVMATSNVFQTTSYINTIAAPLMQYNRVYRPQFKILYDELHSLDSVENVQTAKRISLKVNKEVTFLAASTAISINAIKIIFVSDQAPAAPTTINCQYSARCWYTDA